jgi:hypothetical protein
VPNRLTSRDLEDLEVVDAHELSADGTTSYRDPESVASTTAATKTVVLSGTPYIVNGEYPVEAGDLVTLTGDAAGDYTVASVVDDLTFTVEETIIDSTGGTATFKYAAGATHVGVDPTNLTQTTSNELQQVIEDLDGAIAGGGITEPQHELLDTLTHFINENSYWDATYTDDNITTFIIWTDSGKTKKIREWQITYDGDDLVTQVIAIQYDSAGVEKHRLTHGSFSYTDEEYQNHTAVKS